MYAWVEINLTDIDTTDLVDELKRRRNSKETDYLDDMTLAAAIRRLKALNCPETIIEQLEDWQRQPLSNLSTLQQWREACQVTSKPE